MGPLIPNLSQKSFFEFSALVDVRHFPSCKPVQYQRKLMMLALENDKKINVGEKLIFWPIFVRFTFLDIVPRHCSIF